MASFAQRTNPKNRKKTYKGNSNLISKMKNLLTSPTELWSFIYNLLFDSNNLWPVIYILLPVELILNLVVVLKINCTTTNFLLIKLI